MPIHLLHPSSDAFPDPEGADRNGIVAAGGDLRPSRLLAAYSRGIFPWYSDGLPILWHCPNPRFVLLPEKLHVPRSLARSMRRGLYDVRFDAAFEQVIDACAAAKRPGQDGTWITSEMRDAYVELHRLGHAHSVSSHRSGSLAGGLYGVALGSVFFGESMFASAPDASKVAFVALVERLLSWGFTLVDCQQQTAHLARFGAEAWPRRRFLEALTQALARPGRTGSWS